MYDIEKNVDMPEPKRGRPSVYGFESMESGDSKLDKGAKSTAKSTMYAAAQSYGATHGMKFEGRKVENGVRVWRVE